MSKGKPPSKAREEFGRRLAVVRVAAGFATQAEFAKAIAKVTGSMSQQRYNRYENGTAEPSLETLRAIHAITGVSLNFLIASELVEPAQKTG